MPTNQMNAMQNDAAALANEYDEHGEALIAYTPVGGVATNYKGHVERQAVEGTEGGQGPAPSLVLHLQYDSAGTLGPATVKAGDAASVVERVGESAKTVHVTEILSSTVSGWVLLCR